MKQKKNTTQSTPFQTNTKSGSSFNIIIRISLILLVLIMYGKSVGFEFTLDDDLFYQKHESVQKGVSGFTEFFSYGSMYKFDGTTGLQPYRPVTLSSFSIDKDLYDNAPGKSHLLNLLYYIVLLQVLFSLLKRLLPNMHIALLGFIVLLFATHPIHSEVICSVKSRDEILAALFGFTSWYFLIPKVTDNKNSVAHLILGTFFFMMALFSKESAIAFTVIIPLSYYMLYKNDLKSAFIQLGSLFAAVFIFFMMRSAAFENSVGVPHTMQIPLLDNVLAGATSFAQTSATKMEILFYNLRFVFIPWPLSWDYSYNQIPLVNWTNILPWLGLLSYGLLFLFSILQFKKNPIISFSILYFFISTSPTNNLFFLNGSTFAERFLFTPSLAFAIVIVYMVSKYLKINTKEFSGEKKKLATTIFFTFLILFTGLSIARCPDWQSNFTLFEAGSKSVPNSSRANAAIGSEYMNKSEKESDPDLKKEYIDKSIKFYKKSIEVFPMNSDASYKLGLIYYMNGDTTQAIKYYKQSLEATPKQIYALNNLGTIYVSRNNVDSAYYYFNRTYLADTTNPMSITNYLIASFNKGYDDQVIYLGNQASKFNYSSKVIYDLMSKSYTRKGNNAESQKYLQLMNQTLK